MSKILIAVVTCEKFRDRADAQRATWVPDIKDADVRFFLARQDREPLPDEVFLDVPDDYKSLPVKVKAMYQWALANGYNRCVKMDDDTLLVPNRFMPLLHQNMEYFGFVNATPPKPWCSGFCYVLSERAMRLVSNAVIPEEEWAEDRWVGGVLFDNGIRPHYDNRFTLIIPNWRAPNFRAVAAICDCTGDNSHPGAAKPKSMEELHNMCK